MHDELLMNLIRAGGSRWDSLLAKAISVRLRRVLDAGDEAFENAAGRLEDSLLDTECAMRGVRAARAGCGDIEEAVDEAGASIVRLSVTLMELRNDAVAGVKKPE